MSFPKLEVAVTARSERQRERQRQRELANAVHYLFLPGGSPPGGTLDISDRICVNAPGSLERPRGKFIPQGRLVPLRSFFYPAPVLAHETTSRQIFETGVYEVDDEGCPPVIDAFQPAAAQAVEVFEAYGNNDYGIGLVIVHAVTGVEGIEEWLEPLLWPAAMWPQKKKVLDPDVDILGMIEMLQGAPQRIQNAQLSQELKKIAMNAWKECMDATYRIKARAEKSCESAVNEVESARLGHEGAKQLDSTARYWFRQLRATPPRDEVFTVNTKTPPAGEAVDPTQYKNCAFCDELIKKAALKCRWCNELQPGVSRSEIPGTQAPQTIITHGISANEVTADMIPQPVVDEEDDVVASFGLIDEPDIPKAAPATTPEPPKETVYGGREIPVTPDRFAKEDKKKK